MRSVTKPLLALLVMGCLFVVSTPADAEPNKWPLRRAQNYNWHANYGHYQYGQPVAMVVPPTANMQTNWGWGVGSSRVSRIDHQFGRSYPGPGPFGGSYQNTPAWPQDTTQFGVYHVRAPW